jgi:hypothetical protein
VLGTKIGFNFLVLLLNCLTINQYTVDNTYMFVDRLKNFTNVQELKIASFDVENLSITLSFIYYLPQFIV